MNQPSPFSSMSGAPSQDQTALAAARLMSQAQNGAKNCNYLPSS